jgi:hypothetical protein
VGSAMTYSSNYPSAGWNVQLQGTAGISGAKGLAYQGNGVWKDYSEIGAGGPLGGSFTVFYVWKVHWKWPW